LHPNCQILYETQFPTNLCDAIGEEGRNEGANMRVRWPDSEDVSMWGLHRVPGSRQEIVRGWCDVLRKAAGSPKVFGDKSTAYCSCWQALQWIFGNDAKFIRTSRDIRANSESLLRQQWGPKTLSEAEAHVREHIALAKDCPAYVIRLEELNHEHAPIMLQALELLGLDPRTYPWDEAAKRFAHRAEMIS
jgi:hypothetical protein